MILTFNIKVSFNSLNWTQAIRISNYLTICIRDKHLAINIHHKTYFQLLLGHYYYEELTALLLQTVLPHAQCPAAGQAPQAAGAAELRARLHTAAVPTPRSSSPSHHGNCAARGFAYSAEEFCLVKSYVNVKGTRITLCSSGVCSTSTMSSAS